MIRGHWGIENQLHFAMNLAKSERSYKRGIQAKRQLAASDDTDLLKLLHTGLPRDPAD